jgi:hypothetical protein
VAQEQRFATHAGGSQCGFSAGVAATNHNHIKFVWELHEIHRSESGEL